MAKSFITAHIKIEDHEWASLARHAENNDLTTAQLVRKVLRGWIDSQVIVKVTDDGPITAQHARKHAGFDPHSG